MAKGETFTVTIAIQLDDGCMLPQGRIALALIKEPGGYRCERLEHTSHLAQEGCQAYEKTLLGRAGEQMSLHRLCGKLPHDWYSRTKQGIQ